MKTTHHNGECWYHDIRPLWLRVLRWLVWVGGWDTTHWTAQGVTSRYRAPRRWRPGTRGLRAAFEALTPIALFGHRITLQHFGFFISTRRGYLCVSWPPHTSPGASGWRVYWSPNATPWAATAWLLGAPREVVQAADRTCLEYSADRIARENREAAARYEVRQALREKEG